MSLLLAYYTPTRMVVASDRRVISRGASGKDEIFVGDDCPKFAVLPNGRVFGALGRQDLGERLKSGTLAVVRDNPVLSFQEVADFLPHIARQSWISRKAPQNFDHLTISLLGWDTELGRMRAVDWDGARDFARAENYDPKQNLVAFGVLVPATIEACNKAAHRLKKLEPDFDVIANHLRAVIRAVSRVEQDAVSYAGYFAAFERDKAVALPDEYLLPPSFSEATTSSQAGATVKSEAESGENRFFIGSIMTPAAGSPDTVGFGDGGAGAQIGNTSGLGFSQTASSTTSGGTVSNPGNAIDGDLTSFAAVVSPHGTGSAGASAVLTLSLPPSVIRNYSSVVLQIRRKVTQNFSPTFNQTTYFLRASIGPEGGGGAHVEFDQLQDTSGNVSSGIATLDLIATFGPLSNLSQIYLIVHTASAVNSTSGQIEADIYDVKIVAVE